ncbi:MAG TPA: hypothetical protein VGZ47_13065 [Gemmataceae bacterium]|jgi:hypothetical protein|nr:hypothetical protein [Gemmataceae bacterium]
MWTIRLPVLVALLAVMTAGSIALADDKPATKTYVNSKEGLSAKLTDNYVDFSFDYPASWKVADRSKDPENFVKVERYTGEGKDAVMQESFAVGHFKSSGNADLDKQLIPQLIDLVDKQLKAGLPNYKKTAQGPTKVGSYDGTELRFTGEFKHEQKGTIQMWGRVIVLPDPQGGPKGVMLAVLATPLAPEVKDEKDLGVKGELPTIMKSFKLGK